MRSATKQDRSATSQNIGGCADVRVFAKGQGLTRGTLLAMQGIGLAGLLALGVLLPSCNNTVKAPKTAREADPIIRDVLAVLRGTISSMASIQGREPTLVSGFGVVVGLAETGGGPYPEAIQATMERELSRRGIGKGSAMEGGDLAGVTPKQFLADNRVAVVVVEAVISPGSPESTTFDVRVRSLPGSSTTSLEGGMLWTTDLHLGPPSPFGSMRTRKVAEAYGPVFINPFADPAGAIRGDDGVTRTVGRVLGGGKVTNALEMTIVVDNPSHGRVAAIASAINSRLPAGPEDREKTATGRDDTLLTISVPRRWRTRTDEFVRLLAYTQTDLAFPQEYAKRYTDELKAMPAMAEELSACLVALGKESIPFVAPLYEYPEFLPRMAALRVGAELGDPRTVPHLTAMALGTAAGERPSIAMRTEAITLLGRLGTDPRVDEALRRLVSSPELEIRVAAYEALVERRDPGIARIDVDGRFAIDIVDSTDPLIYITQQGESRIVIFGRDMALQRPLLVSAWRDRFMLTADLDTPEGTPDSQGVRLFYRDIRSTRTVQTVVPETVWKLARFLGSSSRADEPEPGLSMTYSEVVGALYQVQKARGINAAFATERDRLLARLTEVAAAGAVADRPESESTRGEENERVRLLEDNPRPAAGTPGPATDRPSSFVVPIPPRTGDGGKK